MIASELLGLPGVGKSHVLMSIPGMIGAEVTRGWSREKLVNLLAGFWYAGFAVLFLLVYLRFYKRISGQGKLMLVLYERLGRVHILGADNVIDEGVMQALWGVLWRSHPDAVVREYIASIVVLLKQRIGLIYYIRCRRDVHRARVIARSPQAHRMDTFSFTNDEQYQAARRTMAFVLQLLRRNGIRLQYIDNTAE